MTQTVTDKDLYNYLIHDVQALYSTMHSKLTRINEEIRRINKQPYIHKQVDCLEKFKDSRKVIDKMISKISELLVTCRKGKLTLNLEDLETCTLMYKNLKEDYFKIE